MCYYTNWSQYRAGGASFLPENIDANLCTHIIYSFAKLNIDRLATYEWNDEGINSCNNKNKIMNFFL